MQQGDRSPRESFAIAAGDARPHRFGVFASSIVAGVALVAGVWVTQNPVRGSAQPAVGVERAVEQVVEQMVTIDPLETLEIVIRRNDTLDALFRQLELSIADLAALRSLPDVRKSLDRLRPGDVILLTHLDGELKSLTRRISDTALLSVTREEGGFTTNVVETPLEVRPVAMAGTIDSSLYGAVNAAGGTDRLAVDLAEVFRYDIDFVNEVQPGDSFAVSYEQRWRDGEFIREGDILAAEFVNRGRTYRAVRYVMPDGSVEYFTPDGKSIRKAFLRFPVDFGRISSGFNLARRHPVLNTIRAHKGVDFAAPVGTPIKAAGNGRVQFRGAKGGYGNTVVLSHSGGVTTLYAHMSRYARNLKVGDRVKQGEVIGYIGMTGLATGPHLHYEYRVNGVHRNPATIPLPKAEEIPADLREDFLAKAAPLLAGLDRIKAGEEETRVALAAP
ncbi:MAG: peptidoglycan DD-metalloendopeptidase family protein [Steroidobacteraceae bacterium]|nr:peptidoglycan DD-metalloendopeptidase family protein [Steroidobacteraceae bacterium]